MSKEIRIGLIINPIAGVGGSAGLKGSDGEVIQKMAFARGAVKRSGERTRKALETFRDLELLQEEGTDVLFLCGSGEMGEDLLAELGMKYRVAEAAEAPTTADDTEKTAAAVCRLGAELILFAGGDGTARNVFRAVGETVPVMGIPAGVKIHSGVFGNSPAACGKAVARWLQTDRQTVLAEVIDLDEELYRKGTIGDTLYGYMRVPKVPSGMQNPKAASHQSAEDIAGICAEVREKIAKEDPKTMFILGAGSTLMALKSSIAGGGSLLGIDVMQNGTIIRKDVSSIELADLTSRNECRLIVSPIGGQGHIFGRGNQQLTPEVIHRIGPENIWIVSAAGKIYGLEEQTLLVDTGDDELDEELRGYRKVITGWQEYLVCRVG